MERIVYHGSSKPTQAFAARYRARPDEKQQLNFGIHFALEPKIALLYGRFLHECRIRWSKIYNAALVDRWENLPDGHQEVITDIVFRSSNYPDHMKKWLLGQDMVSTNVIERGSNRLVQDVLLEHGFDAVFYRAVISAYIGASRFKTGGHDAYIVIGNPSGRVDVLGISEMRQQEWKEYVEFG